MVVLECIECGNITRIGQISFRVLETEALLNLKYKTIRETNCLREHGLSDLLPLCLPKLKVLFSFGGKKWREKVV